jgi:hypothetical protein
MQTKTPLFLMFVSLACATGVMARDLTATPANLRQQVTALQPGDTLLLQAGKYPGGIWLKGLHGRPDFWGNARDRFDQAGACQSSSQKRPIEGQRRPVKSPAVKTPPMTSSSRLPF